MILLPIVARELRVAARRRSFYWRRSAAALAAIIFGTWLFLEFRLGRPSQSDQAVFLFAILTGSAVLYALLNGALSTADCLSSEKREGTLGLLFLTDLRGYDVVLGKLAASSLNALYGVLAVVPMMGIPLLLGGITLGELARMALLALNTLFFSLALGMGVSAVSRSARSANQTTGMALLLFTMISPAWSGWLEHLGKWRALRAILMLPSPGFAYYAAFDRQYVSIGGPAAFWESMAMLHALGWAFLILASVVTPRSWQDKPAGAKRVRWRERWRLWSYGNLAERNAFRKRLLDANAYYWLAARLRLKPAFVWAVLGLVACAWAWGIAEFRRDWFIEPVYILTGLLLNSLIKTWFASEVGRQLAEDRNQSALELLLSTPLSVRDILHGQLLALRRQFLGPFLVVLAANLFFMTTILTRVMGVDAVPEAADFWISLWTAGIVMLVADLIALYWVGLWQGLVAKSPGRAAMATQARILILPWIAYALAMLLVGHAHPSLVGGYNGWWLPLGLWLGIGLATDVLFAMHAKEKLLTEFRLAATQRFAQRPGSGRQPRTQGASGVATSPQTAP